MKHSRLPVSFCAILLFASFSPSFAQSEIGLRPLFYQNDFSNPAGSLDGGFQGSHAGEWQIGASGRRYLSRHFAGRLESNLVFGRYSFSNMHFSYLNICAIPEWRVSRSVFIGSGAFFNASIKDPLDIEQKFATGILANMGLRHGPFEIQCRFQHWLGESGKFTLGAGIDYFWGLKKHSKKEGQKI